MRNITCGCSRATSVHGNRPSQPGTKLLAAVVIVQRVKSGVLSSLFFFFSDFSCYLIPLPLREKRLISFSSSTSLPFFLALFDMPEV